MEDRPCPIIGPELPPQTTPVDVFGQTKRVASCVNERRAVLGGASRLVEHLLQLPAEDASPIIQHEKLEV